MVTKLLDKYLQDEGYVALKMPYPQLTEYVREEANSITILQVMDLNSEDMVSREQFLEIKDKTRNAPGKDVHVMNLVFYNDYETAVSIVKDEYMCWLIDRKSLVINNDEGRVEDFYGLKDELAAWLENTRILLEKKDMKALGDMLMTRQEREVQEKRRKKKPAPVTVVLVIINCLIYSTYFIVGEAFNESGLMNSELINEGQIYRFVTAMFLHGGIEHLISNMLLLYLLGEVVENKVGSVKYAIIYLVSGILGNVVSYSYVMLSDKAYVSLGASGAVYGIIGAMLYLVIKKTEGLNIPIKRMLFMIAYCIYSSFATAHVDYAAHMGGLIFGFIVTALLCPRGGKAKNES